MKTWKLSNKLGFKYQVERYYGDSCVWLPNGTRIICDNQTDAQLLRDLIARLAIAVEQD